MRTVRCLPDCDMQRLLAMSRRGADCAPALRQFRFAALVAAALWLLIAAPFAIGLV